jgi:predicted metal-dependent peptidase
VEGLGGGGGEEVVHIMYTHVCKCENDKKRTQKTTNIGEDVGRKEPS